MLYTDYDKARKAGATHQQAITVEHLAKLGLLFRDGGIHAEKAGIPYYVWKKLSEL